MDAFGQLLMTWAQWIRALIPLRIVRDWEQGVRMRAGNITALLTPHNGLRGTGLHLFLPLLGEVAIVSVALRVGETTLQTIVTRDAKEATVSLGIRWQISDLSALFARIHDPEETVLDLVRGAAGALIPTLAWEELPGKLPGALLSDIRRRTAGWGVKVHEVYLCNLAAPQALRILSESSGAQTIPGVGL